MNKKFISFVLAAAVTAGTLVFPAGAGAAEELLAFPGAEGGGKYTEGARGAENIEVYHVTNLNDSGEGSLRDAVSEEGRIVVFDVGGVIHLNSQLVLEKDHITILGQTAPGDGITITGNDVLLQDNVSDIIMRYLRIRPSDDSGGEPDGIGGRWINDIILDHCSVSWSVDEALTLYAGSLEENGRQSENITVQNCIVSESMRMSNHIKGAHGYGGIVGGTNASYINNLFAHHDSRSPRFDRNLKSTDFTNNVIYNWGNTNSLYGAEPYSYNSAPEYSTPEYASNVNLVNNYYKYGPSTRASLRSRIFDVSNNSDTLKSNFYVSGNYVYGNDAATADNQAYVNNASKANFLDTPVDMGEYAVTAVSAEEAYAEVLAEAGAALPKRDSIDARVVADVENGTGRIINNDEEIGGLTGIESSEDEFEIPEDWKTENGMGTAEETDLAPSGYTWIEEYVNDWTEEQNAPTNPSITVESPAVADYEMSQDRSDKIGSWTVLSETDSLVYKMTASAAEGTEITKTELWDGETLLKEYGTAEIDDSITLAPGTHYIFSRAYNNDGEKTDSPTSIVYVTGTQQPDGAAIAEIGAAANNGGAVAYPQKSAAWTDGESTYISGSGLIGGTADSCSYMWYQVNGDFEFIVCMEDIPKYENGVLTGIMFRESLDPGSKMVMAADTWLRYGENIVIPMRTETGGEARFMLMRDADGSEVANSGDNTYPAPKYMKIAREGDIFTISVSNNGISWEGSVRQPYEIELSGISDEGYIGIACDSANGQALSEISGGKARTGSIPVLPWYTVAEFSDLRGVNVGDLPTPEPTPEIPPYDDPNTLPTTVPIEIGTFMNISDFELTEGDGYTSTQVIHDGYMRVYATSGKETKIETANLSLDDGTVFSKRLRMTGRGEISSSGVPTTRAVEIMPAEDGVLTVYFYGTGGGTRPMVMMQEGEVIAEEPSTGEIAVLKQTVKGGERVYLYPTASAAAILGIRLDALPNTDYSVNAPVIDEGAGRVSFAVDSNVNRYKTAEAIVAIKDEQGRLLSVELKEVTFDGLGSVDVTADCSAALGYDGEADISLLLWESTDNMIPLNADYE